jgi:hypothetical protein
MCSLTNRRGYLDAVQQGRVARVRGEFGWSKTDDVVIFFLPKYDDDDDDDDDNGRSPAALWG